MKSLLKPEYITDKLNLTGLGKKELIHINPFDRII